MMPSGRTKWLGGILGLLVLSLLAFPNGSALAQRACKEACLGRCERTGAGPQHCDERCNARPACHLDRDQCLAWCDAFRSGEVACTVDCRFRTRSKPLPPWVPGPRKPVV